MHNYLSLAMFSQWEQSHSKLYLRRCREAYLIAVVTTNPDKTGLYHYYIINHITKKTKIGHSKSKDLAFVKCLVTRAMIRLEALNN